jgi:hypothetical protein
MSEHARYLVHADATVLRIRRLLQEEVELGHAAGGRAADRGEVGWGCGGGGGRHHWSAVTSLIHLHGVEVGGTVGIETQGGDLHMAKLQQSRQSQVRNMYKTRKEEYMSVHRWIMSHFAWINLESLC